MTKQELLNELEDLAKWDFYRNSDVFWLCRKLIAGTDEDDPDFRDALDDEIVINIIDLFCDCYDYNGFCAWLVDHDLDIFYKYSSDAEVARVSDYSSFEEFKEKSGAFYNGEPDCLFVNEKTGVYVISW